MWPFPMLRNYATDAMLTELFLSFARTKFSIVKNGTYELHLRGQMGEIKCWNSNRWYAWAHEGTFTPTDAKEAAILWKDRMPSRAAVRKMRQAVEAVEVARFRATERGVSDAAQAFARNAPTIARLQEQLQDEKDRHITTGHTLMGQLQDMVCGSCGRHHCEAHGGPARIVPAGVPEVDRG